MRYVTKTYGQHFFRRGGEEIFHVSQMASEEVVFLAAIACVKGILQNMMLIKVFCSHLGTHFCAVCEGTCFVPSRGRNDCRGGAASHPCPLAVLPMCGGHQASQRVKMTGNRITPKVKDYRKQDLS